MLSTGKAESNVSQSPSDVKEEKVLNLSFDFDGCLAWSLHNWLSHLGPEFRNFSSLKNEQKIALVVKHKETIVKYIINDNTPFLDHLVAQFKQGNYNFLRIMIGTNRQSLWRDAWNAKQGSGSSMLVYEAIEKYFQEKLGIDKVKLDAYLMPDTYKRELSGSKVVEGGSNEGYAETKHAFSKSPQDVVDIFSDLYAGEYNGTGEYLWDMTKLTLLYTQLHRAAEKAEEEKSGKKIDFYFYDDKVGDILSQLAAFFKQNPDLIPDNVNLHLCEYRMHYNGDRATFGYHAQIQGTGARDKQYKDTIVMTAACTLKMENLENRSREQIKESVYQSVKQRVSIAMVGAPDAHEANYKYNATHFRKGRELAVKKAPAKTPEKINLENGTGTVAAASDVKETPKGEPALIATQATPMEGVSISAGFKSSAGNQDISGTSAISTVGGNAVPAHLNAKLASHNPPVALNEVSALTSRAAKGQHGTINSTATIKQLSAGPVQDAGKHPKCIIM